MYISIYVHEYTQGWHRGRETCVVAQGPALRKTAALGLMLCSHHLEILHFEQWTPHFHFAQSSIS